MEAGHSDILYDMLSRTDSPSYGYQLAQGATTLTESWNADPSRSQNHLMLGHAEEWFYSGLAGINFDLSRPSGQQIEIKPSVLPGITSVDASYDSVWGTITSHWNTQGNSFILDVTIPPGTDATVVIPGNAITESGKALGNAEGVAVLQIGSDSTVVKIKSGRYRFEPSR
jgi:alpha-L-rhamnosidase